MYRIQVGDEVPIMDGSAASFCRLIEQCGVVEQDDGEEEFVVDRCFHVGQVDPSTKFILVEPYDGFKDFVSPAISATVRRAGIYIRTPQRGGFPS